MRDPFAAVPVVSVTDPAVIFDSPDQRAEYLRTREPSLYKVKDGARACVFVVAPLSAEYALRLDGAPEMDRAALAFRACVHRVELPDGSALATEAESGFVLGSLAPVEWLRTVALKVGVRRVQEIGEAAYRLSLMEDCDPLSQPHGQPLPS